MHRVLLRTFPTGLKVSLLLILTCSAFAQPPWAWEPFWRGSPGGLQLGVHVEELPFGRLDALQLPYGILVTHVMAGSPAERDGLRAGDILLELNGQSIFSVSRLRWLIGKAAPNARLELKYYRNGETAIASVSLEKSPRLPSPPPSSQKHGAWASAAYLGVSLQSLTEGLREAFAVPDNAGVLVADVYADSAAYRAGLRAGDVIVKMNRRTIRNIDDVRRALDYFDPGEKLKLEIIRDKKREQLEVALGERKGPTAHGHDWQRMQPYDEPYYPGPPFFDPNWWRNEMQDFLKQWKHYWENDPQRALQRAL